MKRAEIEDVVRDLPRERVIALLREVSIESYDHEDTYELREALIVNVADGTIDPERLTHD